MTFKLIFYGSSVLRILNGRPNYKGSWVSCSLKTPLTVGTSLRDLTGLTWRYPRPVRQETHRCLVSFLSSFLLPFFRRFVVSVSLHPPGVKFFLLDRTRVEYSGMDGIHSNDSCVVAKGGRPLVFLSSFYRSQSDKGKYKFRCSYGLTFP